MWPPACSLATKSAKKIAGDPDSPYHSLDLNDDLEIEDDYDEEEETDPDDKGGSS